MYDLVLNFTFLYIQAHNEDVHFSSSLNNVINEKLVFGWSLSIITESALLAHSEWTDHASVAIFKRKQNNNIILISNQFLFLFLDNCIYLWETYQHWCSATHLFAKKNSLKKAKKMRLSSLLWRLTFYTEPLFFFLHDTMSCIFL